MFRDAGDVDDVTLGELTGMTAGGITIAWSTRS
jgi:hypothetical protein